MYELGNHYKVDVKGGKKVKPKAPVVDWSLLGSWYVPAGSKKKYFFIIIIIGVEEGRILLLVGCSGFCILPRNSTFLPYSALFSL